MIKFNPTRSSHLVLLALTLLFGRVAVAGELDYPELNVTPRASDRLQIEADKENAKTWLNLVPIQFSSLVTLSTGLAFTEKPQDGNTNQSGSASTANAPTPSYAKTVGLAVGGAWLAVTLALDMWYRPYESGFHDVNPMPRRTQREQLTRERFAETTIEEAATMGRRLMWAATATNLFASIYMLANAEKGSTGVALAAAAIPAALAPLVFQTHWQAVAAQQREYKKRIYGPISSLSVQPSILSDTNGSLAPGMVLSLRF